MNLRPTQLFVLTYTHQPHDTTHNENWHNNTTVNIKKA